MTSPTNLKKEKTPKKIPQRKCVGCGEMKDKTSLLRVIRDEQGNISIDRKGKANGRGAYLCSIECLAKARKARSLERSLKCSVTPQLYEMLEKEMTADES